jgi:hypothetical protein
MTVLLLLERDDREERSEELPHGQWGGDPILSNGSAMMPRMSPRCCLNSSHSF